MPKRFSVCTLQEAATSFISKVLAEFLTNHRSLSCKYCNAKYLNDECQYIQDCLNNVIPSVNNTIRNVIYRRVQSLLYGDNSDSTEYANRKFDASYFLTLFCMSKELSLEYVSTGDMEDYVFVQKFGKCIRYISFYRDQTVNADCFGQTMNSAVNLESIKLTGFAFTDEMLHLIGKYCLHIRELHGEVTRDGTFTPKGFLKLIFKDVPAKSIRNPCCNSLQVIDLFYKSSTGYDDEFSECEYNPFRDPAMNYCLTVLLRSIPNLKSFGNELQMDDLFCMLEVDSDDSVPHFQTVKISDLKAGSVGILKTKFPKLKVMSVLNAKEQHIQALQSLTTIASITDISLLCKCSGLNDSPLYRGLLQTEWSTLKYLYFESSRDIAVNISEIAKKLPNLEDLVFFDILSNSWDRISHFNTLKSISVDLSTSGEYTFVWFDSFANTVSEINFDCKVEVPARILFDSLRMNYYPELVKLTITSLIFDLEKIKSFLKDTAQLSLLGNFVQQNENQVLELSEYIKENNIDCKIEYTISAD